MSDQEDKIARLMVALDEAARRIDHLMHQVSWLRRQFHLHVHDKEGFPALRHEMFGKIVKDP